jgi:16S rRNA (guanine966-N2)-methyltransferase
MMPRKNRTGPRSPRARHAAETPGKTAHPTRQQAVRGAVRIIGGEWRGRLLKFPAVEGLRPTPDRVRETVFNWLQFELAGRRCLDLFAGSGAFGVEALSRGAAAVDFVEADRVAADAIEQSLRTFNAPNTGRVILDDVFAFLAQRPLHAFDIVFVDPPYAQDSIERACEGLESGGWLAPRAWIYLENSANRGAPAVPATWSLLRSKKAGDVGYHLARRQAAS